MATEVYDIDIHNTHTQHAADRWVVIVCVAGPLSGHRTVVRYHTAVSDSEDSRLGGPVKWMGYSAVCKE
jgi:hypothetical protein